MTTPQEVIDDAYGHSLKNQPGETATDDPELLGVVNRAIRGLYAYAARINPTYFGVVDTVSHDGADGWPRPSGAESVWHIEINSSGDVVAVVPFDDKQAERDLPSVYRFGQIYRPADAGNGPTDTDDLDIYYSKRPSDPGGLAQALDTTWPEQFDQLLALEVAVYLALKDGRRGELQTLLPERNRWAQRFGAFLEHETANERRRNAAVRQIHTETMFPLSSLLAGPDDGGGG